MATDDKREPTPPASRHCSSCGKEASRSRLVLHTETARLVKIFECPDGHLNWED
jgi:hypothetical protein